MKVSRLGWGVGSHGAGQALLVTGHMVLDRPWASLGHGLRTQCARSPPHPHALLGWGAAREPGGALTEMDGGMKPCVSSTGGLDIWSDIILRFSGGF